MSAFSLAFTQFFSLFATLFTAAEKLAKTADNLASVAEESSGTYRDQARIQRLQRLAVLNAETSAQEKQLALGAPITAQ